MQVGYHIIVGHAREVAGEVRACGVRVLVGSMMGKGAMRTGIRSRESQNGEEDGCCELLGFTSSVDWGHAFLDEVHRSFLTVSVGTFSGWLFGRDCVVARRVVSVLYMGHTRKSMVLC